MLTEQSAPLVTIILPVRNEGRYIAACLDAVCAQDYAALEIVVVDGISDDDTRALVAARVHADLRVRMVDNPEQSAAAAMNRGLRAAHGDIIIRVDGHAVIARDYVRQCVALLAEMPVDCVGGPIHTIGTTWIALAQSSPFGVGSAVFRYAHTGQFVDTLAFGAYCREVFQSIGGFDETLVRNQDDEFNLRLIRSGGKIWLDPRIHSEYYSRTSLRGLWQQYFEYGFWKVRVIQKHRRPASARHLVPALFVFVLGASLVASALTENPLWLLVVVVPYVLVSFVISAWLAQRSSWRYVFLLPLAFGAMHLAYGLGFLAALVHTIFYKSLLVVSLQGRKTT